MKRLTFFGFLLCACYWSHAQTKNFIDQPFIEVSGYADTLVTPDEIYLGIQLSEKDTRDRVSMEDLEQKMVSSLQGLGLDTEKDLTTSDMMSNFKYYLLKSKDIIKTKRYSLKVSDGATATRVLIKLEEAGISNVSVERVDFSGLQKLKLTMRTMAILNAKEKAIALTMPLNQIPGAAIHIADLENQGRFLQGTVAGIQIRGAESEKMEDRPIPKIEFEKIRVEVSVTAIFRLQ